MTVYPMEKKHFYEFNSSIFNKEKALRTLWSWVTQNIYLLFYNLIYNLKIYNSNSQ